MAFGEKERIINKPITKTFVEPKRARGREPFKDQSKKADVNIPAYFTKEEASIIDELREDDMLSKSAFIRKILRKYFKELKKI